MKVDEVNGFRGGERPLIRDGASASGCVLRDRFRVAKAANPALLLRLFALAVLKLSLTICWIAMAYGRT